MTKNYKRLLLLTISFIFVTGILPLSSMTAVAAPDTLPISKTVSTTVKLNGVHVAGDYPATQAYNDGTYSGTLTRQDSSLTSVVRATPTVTYNYQSDKQYPIDKAASGQFSFPATYTTSYYDSVSGQNYAAIISKSGSPYFSGTAITQSLYWTHYGYQYDPVNHTTLGYMSNNSTTYYGGSYKYANAPRKPTDYYGPPAESGLGWVQYQAPIWDGALQDATQEPWKSLCMLYYGQARFQSDDGDTYNRYRKPVRLYYRRSAQCKYIYQLYSGTTSVTDSKITYSGTVYRANDKPGITITHIPVSPVSGDNVDISFLPSDPNGDTVTLTATIQPMGEDNKTPGIITTICTNLSRSSGQTYQYTLSKAATGYYKAAATVTDAGGLTASATDTIQVMDNNAPPQVSLSADKTSYFEGDQAIVTALVYDPNGDNLAVTFTEQDLGELGQNPGPVTTLYSGTVPSGSIIKQTDFYMIPHILKFVLTARDPGGLSDSTSITITAKPKPIEGAVSHTDKWEEARQSYNAWVQRNDLGDELLRPYSLFFRGERFVLSATTSKYLKSNYVTVYIKEHPEYSANMDSTDGWNWTSSEWGSDMRWWPAQQLTFVFTNQYIDGTVTTDEVVVNIDTEEYFQIHELY